jgi:hypothetical protein
MPQTEKYTSRQFLKVFAISSAILLIAIGLTTYIIDPFFQFRVNTKDRYILNPRFVNGGLAKHYDYNTVVMGSSMVQNFKMALLRDTYEGMKPVKLSAGGLNIPEMEYIYTLINMERAEDFIINVDVPLFNQFGIGNRLPLFLYEDGLLNKLEYLYGYDALIRYIPADLGVTLYFKVTEGDVPIAYKMKTSIDDIGNDSYGMTYSAEEVKRQYINGIAVSPQILDSMEVRMQNTLDSMLVRLDLKKHADKKYTFMFPSYSGLYWYHARKYGYYAGFIDFVRYFTKSVQKYPNARIVFFFDREEITDLNYYSDITHFGPVLSDKISKDIYNPEYELTKTNLEQRIAKTDSLVNVFIEQNRDWLPKD